MKMFLILLLSSAFIGVISGFLTYLTFSKLHRKGQCRGFMLIGIAFSYIILAILYFISRDFEALLGISVANWFKYIALDFVAAFYLTRVAFYIHKSILHKRKTSY